MACRSVRSMARASASAYGSGWRPKARAGPGSRTMTSLRSPSMSGRAMPDGTGETRLTQYELRRGVSTGTGIIRRRRPRSRA